LLKTKYRGQISASCALNNLKSAIRAYSEAPDIVEGWGSQLHG